jgi:hypothetical protein
MAVTFYSRFDSRPNGRKRMSGEFNKEVPNSAVEPVFCQHYRRPASPDANPIASVANCGAYGKRSEPATDNYKLSLSRDRANDLGTSVPRTPLPESFKVALITASSSSPNF